MKEKIERFAKGNFDYDNPSICLSEYELNITAEAGKITEGSFTVTNTAGRRIKGKIYSSDSHMRLQKPIFDDIENEINYSFDASCLKAGDCINGCFNIISDCGECILNYNITIEPAYIQIPAGKITDMDQFTALARMDWVEAKRIFRSEDFERIFLDREQSFIYRNLIKSVSTSQALEEFLISVHKKTPVLLEIDKTNLEYRAGEEDIADKLMLTKSNWGYAEIRVSCDAAFIQLEQKYLWADRFIGNTHQILFSIDAGQLKKGNNYGHIYIKTPLQTLTVNVLCHNDGGKAADIGSRAKTELTENYLKFRQGSIELNEYADRMQKILKYLQDPETVYIREFVKLHLAILNGRSDLAKNLLDQLSEEDADIKRKSVFEYCVYLYLNALYVKTEKTVAEAAEIIRGYYIKGNNDWRMLWLLLYTDKSYAADKTAMLADIREQFINGCRSPVLYHEAICCYNEEPSLLRELSPFEIQVVNYGAKYDIIDLELARQFTYLAAKKKTFNPVVFHILESLYDKYKSEDILSAICSTLIKGLKRSERYFGWFSLGVKSQLKITGLYEYYMYSISNDYRSAIDQSVMLYFIYNSNLNEQKTAQLYANIIKYKADNENIFRSYSKRIEVFAGKMLEKHLINDNLAVLYNELGKKNLLDEELSGHLPYVIFRKEITCDNPNMVSATILHKEMETEETVQLVEGKAQVDIYSSNYEIIFADSFGNRYIQSVKYELKSYLDPDEYVEYCIDISNNCMLLLYMYDRYLKAQEPAQSSIMLIRRILELEGLAPGFQTECLKALIRYYDNNNDEEQLQTCFERLDMNYLAADERLSCIELMIKHSCYDKVLKAIETYGYEDLPPDMLIKLCFGWLQAYGTEEKQPLLVSLCYYIFVHNKYDELILTYLVRFYRGSTEQMLSLLQAAKGFELDTHRLMQRLLVQMLFCESHIDESFTIFCDYYNDISNRLLVRAYLTYHAYRYLVHGHDIADGLFPIIRRELCYEENEVCLLAWLKKNACENKLSENDLKFAEYNIERLVRKGIILPFMLDYKDKLSLPDRLIGKHYITYVSRPGNQVFIHYCMKNHGNEYVTERMPNIFMGIHMKELVLFYNDEVRYYITEELPDGVKRSQDYTFHYVCDVTDEATKYNQINKMLIALEKRDDTELLDMMEAYVKTQYMTGACFRQI